MYAVPASNVDGQICVNVPHAGRPVMFFVTSIQLPLAPPSFVYQSLPSFVPAQIEALLNRRRRDREHDFAVELAEVVADDAAGRDDVRRILRREIRAELRPRLPLVRRLEDRPGSRSSTLL